MLLGDLREEVLAANLELVRRGVVVFTFGNVSGISRKDGLVAIKPSGVPYEELTVEQIVVSDLDGRVVDGNLRPSSDLPTHLELYKHFPNIGGVAHTHSEYGTAWAQAKRPIPCSSSWNAIAVPPISASTAWVRNAAITEVVSLPIATGVTPSGPQPRCRARCSSARMGMRPQAASLSSAVGSSAQMAAMHWRSRAWASAYGW